MSSVVMTGTGVRGQGSEGGRSLGRRHGVGGTGQGCRGQGWEFGRSLVSRQGVFDGGIVAGLLAAPPFAGTEPSPPYRPGKPPGICQSIASPALSLPALSKCCRFLMARVRA